MNDDPLVFGNRAAFRGWLVENHQKCPGIWLMLGKDAKVVTLTANEALEEALCFGWIDGQLRSLGADKYLKRFTPRRKASVWSERNRKLAEKLTEDGLMTAAGLAAIAEAHRRGAWDRPKREPISEAQVDVLTEALSGSSQALANFLRMSPSVRRTYTALYLDAKANTLHLRPSACYSTLGSGGSRPRQIRRTWRWHARRLDWRTGRG